MKTMNVKHKRFLSLEAGTLYSQWTETKSEGTETLLETVFKVYSVATQLLRNAPFLEQILQILWIPPVSFIAPMLCYNVSFFYYLPLTL